MSHRVNLTMPEELIERMKQHQQRTGVTVAEQFRRAIAAWLPQEDKEA